MCNVFRLTLLLAFGLLMCGCSQGHQLNMPPLHPVNGTVALRGRPTAGIRVIFNPVTDIGIKYSPVAITDITGAYQITSLQPGDGAPVGEYAVTFEWPDHINDPSNGDPTPEIDRFRGAYVSVEKSQFKVIVQAGENTVPQFDLR